jgi:pimeloyl-ACP methyl ester carboxylesterase
MPPLRCRGGSILFLRTQIPCAVEENSVMHRKNTSAAAPTLLGHALHGSGSTHVIVLHDWNGDHRNYAAVLPWLDPGTFTYAFVDLRGYGRSRGIPGAYTLEEIAGDCLALADHLGWRGFHLIGHSMTGRVVQRIAADAPARVRSAIAVCPMSAAGSRLDPATLAFFASTTTDDDAFRRLMRFVSGPLSEHWVEAKLRQSREAVEPACRRGYLDMFTGVDFSAEVDGLGTPFLVLVGDRDPGIDPAAMARTFLAWHPNAELVQFRDCGHYPMQECPPQFATAIEAFMRRFAG